MAVISPIHPAGRPSTHPPIHPIGIFFSKEIISKDPTINEVATRGCASEAESGSRPCPEPSASPQRPAWGRCGSPRAPASRLGFAVRPVLTGPARKASNRLRSGRSHDTFPSTHQPSLRVLSLPLDPVLQAASWKLCPEPFTIPGWNFVLPSPCLNTLPPQIKHSLPRVT